MKDLAVLAAILAVTIKASPFPAPQGVTAKIPASGNPPAGCGLAYQGEFGMTVVPVHSHEKRKQVPFLYKTFRVADIP